jgi:hypothetical protein
MGRELTRMYHWFEEKGFHFNIEQPRREYPLTHTFNPWRETYWNTTAVAARRSQHFRPWFCGWRQERISASFLDAD